MRLRGDLAPPHWKKGGDRWDAGYETTGYLLDWIEKEFGNGTVMKINESLNDKKYDENLFVQITGSPVQELWKRYLASLKDKPPVL